MRSCDESLEFESGTRQLKPRYFAREATMATASFPLPVRNKQW